MAPAVIENTVAEEIKIALLLCRIGISGAPPPFNQKLKFIGKIINTKRSIKTGGIKNGCCIRTTTGDFTNNRKIFLAD